MMINSGAIKLWIIIGIIIYSSNLLWGQKRYIGTVSKVFEKLPENSVQNDSITIEFYKSFHGDLKIKFNDSLICNISSCLSNSTSSLQTCGIIHRDSFKSGKGVLKLNFNGSFFEELIDLDYAFIRLYYEQRDRKVNIHFQNRRIYEE